MATRRKRRCHKCSTTCITTRKGLVVCDKIGKRFRKMTKRQKKCASKSIPKMVREWKKSRWSSYEQAVAVGLSKARKC